MKQDTQAIILLIISAGLIILSLPVLWLMFKDWLRSWREAHKHNFK